MNALLLQKTLTMTQPPAAAFCEQRKENQMMYPPEFEARLAAIRRAGERLRHLTFAEAKALKKYFNTNLCSEDPKKVSDTTYSKRSFYELCDMIGSSHLAVAQQTIDPRVIPNEARAERFKKLAMHLETFLVKYRSKTHTS